jgi:hypothetical protein
VPVAIPTRVEAELFVREMKTGRNGAVHVRARDAQGVAVDCVVKLAGGMAKEQRAMLPIPYLCEWLAAAIGTALGMTVAAPYEVIITKEYADAVTDAKHRAIALAALGSVFGSKYASAGTSQYTLELPDPCLRTAAAELVAFDTFIHNPDRRRTNPNLFVSRGELLAFDHGDAFSFLLPILFAPDPALDPLEKCVDDHACRPWLHKREFSLDRFREALVTLTDQVFDEIVAATPTAWTEGPAQGKLSYVVDVMKKRRDAAPEWLPKVEAWLSK